MTQQYRLNHGGLVDRRRPLTFRFDGIQYQGYHGDTLASALLANGVHLVGRSFKYHRPRGIYTAGVEEMNALVDVLKEGQADPNTRATVVALEDGIEVSSQNRWPSLRFDVRSFHGMISRLIPAGFYYKTFMWPAKFWPKYEHMIRHAAGLGRAPLVRDRDRYEKQHAYCDVLVVGAGPAGLAAARSACQAGLRVLLVDEKSRVGGTLPGSNTEIEGVAGAKWATAVERELRESGHASVMLRTTAFGYYDHDTVALAQQCDTPANPHGATQRLWYVHAKQVVLAAGAIERPCVFANNDLPGVMLASAARTYCNEFGVAVGRRVLVLANNDSAYEAALDLQRAGIDIVGVVDQREAVSASLSETLASLRIPHHRGSTIKKATGRHRVRCAVIVDQSGLRQTVRCDTILVSGGWTPSVHLHSQSGGKVGYDADLSTFVPTSTKQHSLSIGACAGRLQLSECLADGASICAQMDGAAQGRGHPATPPKAEKLVIPPPHLGCRAGKRFIDIQDDVTVEDIELAARENFRSVEHLKRYTTLGMGTDQGKTSNVNGLTIMGALRAESPGAVGTTTFRPPYTPIRLGLLSGRNIDKHFSAIRVSPMHEWHVRNGAVMGPANLWLRPKAYLRGNESYAQAWQRECRNVRQGVGIVDVSTLGKIEVQGPDAGVFLDRVYANRISTLKVGKARYGVLLREDGIVFDDGTIARWGERLFILSTTTANAAAVMSHFEFLLATAWPTLRVRVTSVTDHYAQIALAGPKSREVLERLQISADVSDSALPHMAVCETVWNGLKLLIYRVSFSGERAYELAIAAAYGQRLWDQLLAVGAPFSIMPYGTEAMGALRIEKGHPAGPELDGRTTAADLGLGGLVKKEGAFVGKALLGREGLQAADRPTLVGLRSKSGAAIQSGSMLVPRAEVGAQELGWVASATYSPTLDRHIALGFLVNGANALGRSVLAWSALTSSQVEVEVVNPCFVDIERERLLG
ncbi:sarcosine oxidase subunit alpha family protein [Bordetella bronchiseptica]|uniref:sarcosine oxidase subunit alpha family protein n=1 Tax=Bordetella bronchiseptica TaxID=518 RepID=UPI000460D9C6|nr:sarcosine oxidase subunit alpha family protein [Bordetella bronchiseptica]KDC58735.1 sarcosine oxidase, alpha subunit family [Bordetella bronchiseptica MBORD591]